MLISFPPLILYLLNVYFPRVRTFWFSFVLGLVQDLLTLSLPLGFFTALYSGMSFVLISVKPYLPPLSFSVRTAASVFLFTLFFSLIQSLLLSTFQHWVEDLFLGPLIDTTCLMLLIFVFQWFQQRQEETTDHHG